MEWNNEESLKHLSEAYKSAVDNIRIQYLAEGYEGYDVTGWKIFVSKNELGLSIILY